jgi:selenocysteine-specific translation elongation factor
MVLWDRPEQIGTVEGVTLSLANPLQKKALEMLQAIDLLGAEVDKISAAKDDQMTPLATDIRKKIKRANKSLQDMETDVGQSRRQREIVKQCRNRLDDVTKKMLRDVFDLDDLAVEDMIANLKDKE